MRFGLRKRISLCSALKLRKKMAGAGGLEPVTSAVTGQRSNQLSYAPAWGPEAWGQAGEPKERKCCRQGTIRISSATRVHLDGVAFDNLEPHPFPSESIGL